MLRRELRELLRLGLLAASGCMRDERASTAGRSWASPSSSHRRSLFGDVLDRLDRRLRRVAHDLFHLPPRRAPFGCSSGVAVVIHTDRQQHHEARQAGAGDEEPEPGAEVGREQQVDRPAEQTDRARCVTSTPRIVGSHSVFSPPPCSRGTTARHRYLLRPPAAPGPAGMSYDVSSRPSRSYVDDRVDHVFGEHLAEAGHAPGADAAAAVLLVRFRARCHELELVQRKPASPVPKRRIVAPSRRLNAMPPPLPPPPPGQAEHVGSVGDGGIEGRPALRVAARAVELEQQLAVGDVLARGRPLHRPFEVRLRVLEPASASRNARRTRPCRDLSLRRRSADRRARRRARCSRRRVRRRASAGTPSASTSVACAVASVSSAPANASSAAVELAAASPCAASDASPASRCASSGVSWIVRGTRRGPRSSGRSRRRRRRTPQRLHRRARPAVGDDRTAHLLGA